jgi:tetratricopeptide (TPR) repeat protein
MARTFNFQAAAMHAARGVNLAEELGDDDTRMQLHITLGDSRQQLGESELAAADYSRALAISRNRDDEQHEAMILYKLGYAQLDSNDTEAAVDTWEHALTLFKRQARRRYEGRVLGALGSAYGDLGRWAEAVNFHTSALYIARETQDRDEESLQLVSLAFAATQANQLGLLLQSRRHVTVAELLVEDALTVEPGDRELEQLRERIASEYQLAESYGTKLIEVAGTAQDYAANAYALLEN